MVKRWVIVGAAALIVLAVASIALWPREPKYLGKSLSQWLAVQTEDPKGSAQAMTAMGSRAVPHLLRWLDAGYAGRLGPDEGLRRMRQAHAGFVMLGTNASGAAAELAKIAGSSTDSTAGPLAASALSFVGQRGLQPLVGMTASHGLPPGRRLAAITALRNMTYLGTNAAPCISALVECAADTNQMIRSTALTSLSLLGQPVGMPVSVAGVKWKNPVPEPALRWTVMRALIDFATNSDRMVFEMILRGTNDPDPRVQAEVVQFLTRRSAAGLPR